MRKILCLFLPFLLLCGCAVKSQAVKPVTKALSFDAQITYYNETYECNVKIFKNGDSEITFSSPKEIKGLKISYSANTVTADYNGLKYEINGTLPQFSASDILHKAFNYNYDTVYTNDNEYYVENKNLNCKMYLGATGLPIKIIENSEKFSITIKNATINEKEP